MPYILSALLFVACMLSSACSRSGPPALEVGVLNGIEAGDPDLALIMEALQNLLVLVDQKRLEELPGMVSEERGLYVDLKSHRQHKDLPRDISRPDSYLSLYYLDSSGLRARTGDPTQMSVRDVLRTTRLVRVDVFREGPDEVELKLHLVDNPDESYRLNNPVFIRENGRWLVYRLF